MKGGRRKITLLSECQTNPHARIRALYLHAGFNHCYQTINFIDIYKQGEGLRPFKKFAKNPASVLL